MTEGTQVVEGSEEARKVKARLKELDRQISNLRWRQGRNLRDGIHYAASKMGLEIDALVRKRNELLSSASGADAYADLDLLDPAHEEAHRKELRRMFREHHGLAAYRALGMEIMDEVRHEDARMREEVEWVKGE